MMRAAIFGITAILTATLAHAQDITGSWLARPTQQRLVERFLKFAAIVKTLCRGTYYRSDTCLPTSTLSNAARLPCATTR